MTSTITETAPGGTATRRLHEGWSVEAVGGPVPAELRGKAFPATVPGSVHTDLLAAGAIEDPYLDDQERLQAWIGLCDWRYSTAFEWHPQNADRVDLVFEGLDTVALVKLNGTVIAETRNMHRTYRVDARDALREGSNELVITFESPVRFADRESLAQGYRPHVNHHPYNAIRKMACNFGWDWGPDVATVGIWRPVTLESWSGSRLASVRPNVDVDGTRGIATVQVDLAAVDAPTDGTVSSAKQIEVRVGDCAQTVELTGDQNSVTVKVPIDDVAVWWPAGYGAQPLYPLHVTLKVGGDTVDSWHSRLGFRTVRVDVEPDETGTPFTIIVNDRPIYVKGANWIPDDAFIHRVDRARYEERIRQAQSANINLLRVWGGGIYESDDFYDVCDELGVLTWQDFLFACAAYSEDSEMRAEVEGEVRDNVVRLLPHPSLVVWNGSNENIWGYQEWGWAKRLRGKDWGLGYYLELLPALLAELDPSRPYTPSSPFSPDGDHYPNDPDHGSVHLWELWNRRDYPEYRLTSPRFVGEFGWQGPPTWSTMTRSISDSPLTPESPGMLVHQKAQDGNVKLIDGLVDHLPLPDDIDDWHWAMSLNQATAVQVGIEHFRSLSPRCMGSIVWQLNDCWPVTSWAAVDGDGRPKPLLYSIAHAYADRLLTIQPREQGLILALVNDTDEEWGGDVAFQRMSFDGTVLETATAVAQVDRRGTVVLDVPAAIATAADPAGEFVRATLGTERALWFFTEYRDSKLEKPRLEVSAVEHESGYAVTVTAGNLVRDVSLLVDKLAGCARVDEQLVTLLPGESTTFMVTSDSPLSTTDFAGATVLRSANQLVAGVSA